MRNLSNTFLQTSQWTERSSITPCLTRWTCNIRICLLSLLFSSSLEAQPYLSTDPVPPCYEIQARIRNGGNQYEAVLYTPSTPTPSQPGGLKWKMNPTGDPVWSTNGNQYGQLIDFSFHYAAQEGISTFQIDFNRDGDYTDPQETITNEAPTLAGKGFKYINLMLQGNEIGKTVTLEDLVIDNIPFGMYSCSTNTPLNLLFEDQDGLFNEVTIAGKFTFSGYGSVERPRFWIRLNQPNIAPVCILTSPISGTVFDSNATISLTSTAEDFHPIQKVEFYTGSTKIGEDTQAPYSITWHDAPVGGHVIRAKATDSHDAYSYSAPAFIAVGDSSSIPTDPNTGDALVQITYPAHGAILFDPDTIHIATASHDSTGVISFVEFLIDEEVIGRDSVAPFDNSSLVNMPMGTYQLKARTTKQNGMVDMTAVNQFTVRCIKEDINIDGVVSTFDFLLMLAAYGEVCSTACGEDFNDDGVVSAIDFLRILAVFGYSCL